ncbi:hypothetical protein EIH07_01775 [Chryseobacterium taklimakanense]|uniref:hypothetical protein n=1 Tax=Chryseobacterium taklimakanense TaxID=536441 RepID=UPI000F601F05|nr:hypothetical protein [Chryseobacterium taklimakanense]AZI21859.1 hypothetical protein EIH07_01775 [Chryseobacterium taklimakanense]
MNARVLELLKNPENIQSDDLKLLESEIKSKPYIQNIRALHLLGTHRYNPEIYQKILSETAAYTTDKKILYHFINKKSVAEAEKFSVEGQYNQPQERNFEQTDDGTFSNVEEPTYIEINGEKNRILFKGEENFFEFKDEEKNDGVSLTQNQTDDVAEQKIFPGEVVYEEEKIIETKNSKTEMLAGNSSTEIDDTEIVEGPEKIDLNEEVSSEVSFHGIDNFFPNIAVPVEKKVENYQPKHAPNRHEEEMKRLIAEVEAKIKARKQAQPTAEKTEEEEMPNFETNFTETQEFNPKKTEDEPAKETVQTDSDKTSEAVEQPEEIPVQNAAWKPMSLVTNTPDGFIKKEESPKLQEKPEAAKNQPDKAAEFQGKITEEERPVFNVSFFASSVSKIEGEKAGELVISKAEDKVQPQDSNVPQFINTWQKWLKIERREPEPSKEEIKEKAIEKFIENEPKISKLKEETTFVVKEKAGDISHLMTETLAKLYVEQRLYSKAIKAYEALQQKHPEKSDYFAEKIREVKDLRSGK